MNADRRLLAALAVVLAPGRAARLLALLADPSLETLRSEAGRLAGAPRHDRLSALARALAAAAAPSPRDRRLVVRLAQPAATPTVPQTDVRRTDGPAPDGAVPRGRTALHAHDPATAGAGLAVAARVARCVERSRA